MKAFATNGTATCIAALLTAGAASADVTAQEVWDNWKEGMSVYGQEGITIGSETMVGSSLTITDLTMEMSEDGTSITSTIPSIVFTERGDGTVSVVMSESYPVTITGAPGESATINVTQTGIEMVVSGDSSAMTYDFTANRIGVSVDEIRDRDEVVPAEILLNMNNVTGSYTTSYGDLNVISYDMDVGGVDILVDVNDEAEDLLVNFSGQIADLAVEGEMGMPADMDFDAPESMFIDGFYLDAGYSFGQSAYLFAFEEGSDMANGTASLASGALELSMNYDGISYSNALTELAVSFSGSEVPFPVDLSLGEYGVNIALPLSQSNAPKDFSASFKLVDLAVNDMIWSMADPGGVLPRDPASLIIALSGSGSLFYDLLDPAQAMEIARADMPGALNSLTLDELTVQIAGAEVLGDGSFTFDNNDLTTFPGVPRPEGELNVAVNGANGLIDKLTQMGLLPEEQVMGARMMMGVFATPVGDDMLTSKIEVNDQGHVIANGQRLQ
ncbi:DUF2125 domain-containing protein [Flavimaricola marinus]|uniref:DUF2125 domain-containing protein n=1 Tax=Flavimaricola marinus TaxID=1819565 RepID=A0A238LFB1_9RHOB|nr:DUF2125 domain-containing protein [Flavimaricola marinus]SMY08321.1 hypothetical protein LOM8899_02472 [Flavimaricola marinus]